MIKPRPLQPGDTIAVVAPASPMQVSKLETGLDYLKKQGYRIELGEHIFDSYGYLAGHDKDRMNDLLAMFASPNVDAIISCRGGYGTPRLLDSIDYNIIAKNPKIFVGYSDLTALQLAIWKHTNLVTFSGPMVAVEMASEILPFTETYFWRLLCQNRMDDLFNADQKQSLQILQPGKAKGVLLGGCLSLVSSIIGTKHQPDFTGAILILEDIGEQPYRIDRYLAQLQSAGIFQQVNGIILSQFVDCLEKEGEPTLTLDEIFHDYFSSLSIPVVSNFLYGHTPKKFTIPFGVTIEIDTGIPGIQLLETAVDWSNSE
jgi:muramoyltetrapeptide carboxypeptidase